MAIIMLTLNTKQSIAVLIVGLLLSAGVSAEDDPHWNKGTCQVCHVDAAPVAGNISLHEGDAEALCETETTLINHFSQGYNYVYV